MTTLNFSLMNKVVIALCCVLSLGACAAHNKQLIPEDKFSLKEQAVVMGRIYYTRDSLFGASTGEAFLSIENLGTDVQLASGTSGIDYAKVDATKNVGDYVIGGETFAYYVNPGTYVVAPSPIWLGDKKYYVANPAKRNALLGVFTAAFTSDFYKNPNEYVRSMNPTLVPGVLGALEVKAGEVIYFGDILVLNSTKGFAFITFNRIDLAKKKLQSDNKAFANDLVFRPWTGPRFISSPEKNTTVIP